MVHGVSPQGGELNGVLALENKGGGLSGAGRDTSCAIRRKQRGFSRLGNAVGRGPLLGINKGVARLTKRRGGGVFHVEGDCCEGVDE